MKNNSKDKGQPNKGVIIPIEYEKFYEKFVHIITRTVKANNWKTAPNIREFREERANRVHWIRPILENCDDNRAEIYSRGGRPRDP